MIDITIFVQDSGATKKRPEVSAADKAEAERLKNKGNNCMSSQNYQEAHACYTKYVYTLILQF